MNKLNSAYSVVILASIAFIVFTYVHSRVQPKSFLMKDCTITESATGPDLYNITCPL